MKKMHTAHEKVSIKRLISFLKPSKKKMIFAIIISLIGTVPTILSPHLTEKISDQLFKLIEQMTLGQSGKIAFDGLISVILITAFVFLAGFIISSLSSLLISEITQSITYGIRQQINQKINRVPISYFDKKSIGDVLSRSTNDVDNLAQNLGQTITEMITSLVTIIGLAIMMFVSSWQLALVVIISVPLGMILLGIIMSFSQKYFVSQQRLLGDINGHIEEAYGAQEIIKIFNASKVVKKEFSSKNRELKNVSMMSNFFMSLMQPLMSFTYNLSYIAVLVVAGVLVAKGQIQPAVLISFLVYVRLFSNPIINMAQYSSNLQTMSAAAKRIDELLTAEELEDESDKHAEIEALEGSVEFKHVAFGYVSDQMVIKDFSATIKPGYKVAIVGPTGAGKTTLVNLLMRFYEFDGDIVIDGISTKEMKREKLAGLFSMVLQDTWLFDGTIEDNLRYNSQNVTKEEIIQAAKLANVHHYIESLPKGYDTLINEKSNVSGGQRQLLTIARAMIQKSPMLILDEATSNVDTRTEVLIQKAMDHLMKQKTSFVIAHRLSTIKNADLILVLKDGNIIEQGTHQSLLDQKGFYQVLYKSQFDHNE